jgi:protocatechuate 3,4-dioxygenase beta subunit
VPRRVATVVLLLVAVVLAALFARSCGTDDAERGAEGPATDDGPALDASTISFSTPPRQRERAKAAAPGEAAAAPADDGTKTAADKERTTRLTFVVSRREDGERIAGATVLAADRLGHREFTTDRSGLAEFEVAPGGVNFGVVAPGRAREQGSFEARAEPMQRDVRLGIGAVAVGRITDAATDAPVAGALVTVRIGGFDGLSTYHWAGDWEVGHATTGADGRFTIEGMAPGTVFTLHAEAKGYADGERPATPWVPGRCTCDLALQRGRTIRGVVLDPGGTRAPGVHVECRPAWQRPVQPGPFGDGARTTRADPAGGFSFAGLEADGAFVVRARGDEYGLRVVETQAPVGVDEVILHFEAMATLRVRTSGGVPGDAPGDPLRASLRRLTALPDDSDLPQVATDGSESVQLSPGRYRVLIDEAGCDPEPSAEVVLRAGQETTCEIRLGSASFEGVVRDADARPVAEAHVSLRETGGEGRTYEASTDSTGKFRLDGVAPGRHRLRIELHKYARLSEDVEVPSAARAWTLRTAGVARINLPETALGRDVLVILDRVADPGEEGDADGWVPDLASTSAPTWNGSNPYVLPVGVTGRIRFRVLVEGFLPAQVETIASAGEAFPVEVPDLVRGVVLSGRISSPEGDGVGNATVTVVDRIDARRTTFSGPDGSFVTEAVAPGEVRLRIQPRERYLPVTVDIPVREDGNGPLSITLHRGGQVEFVLADERGVGVPGVDLDIRDALGELSAWAVRTDHRGRTRARLNPGKHRVTGPGVEPATVEVAEDAEQTVRLVAR